jgi:hypothetical protein
MINVTHVLQRMQCPVSPGSKTLFRRPVAHLEPDTVTLLAQVMSKPQDLAYNRADVLRAFQVLTTMCML